MIDPAKFLEITSAKTQFDDRTRQPVLGFIDDDFDILKYPQELPRVMFPGQPLSNKGFKCLNTYTPAPSDRVMLVPVGTSDYVIVGSIDPGLEDNESIQVDNDQAPFSRGDLVFFIDNHGSGQNQGGGSGSSIQWTEQQSSETNGQNNKYGFWTPSNNAVVTPQYPGFYRIEGRIMFPTASATASDWKRIEVIDGSGNPYRCGDFRVSAISGQPTSLIFMTPPLWFSGTSLFRIRASGSTGGGTAFGTAELASFIQVFFEGWF
jgi:hypothetical protein